MLRIATASLDPRGGHDRPAEHLAVQLSENLGASPATAAIFFASTALGPAYDTIERAIRQATGAASVVGCSASEIFDPEARGGDPPLLSALAFSGDAEVRRLFCSGLRGRAEEIGRELGRAAKALECTPKAILLLADTYNLAPDELLAGCASSSPATIVVGAGASEDGSSGATAVVGRGVATGNAVAALALGGVRIRTMVSPSTAIVGRWWTITRAEGNRALELEGRPALDVFSAALPATLREDLRAALHVTLAALREPSTEQDGAEDYLIRPLLGVDARSSAVAVGDELVPGMEMAVAVRDPVRARETLDRRLAAFVAQSPPLAGALYLATGERGSSGFGIPGIEAAYLRRHLGDCPIAGFFCGAGIAPLAGRNRLHQHGSVLVGFERD